MTLREQPFLFGGEAWLHVWDGNATAAALYDRHYSRNPKARGDPRIAGPGEKIVLLTPCARGLFVWRKFISKDGQLGINCAIFRNEGAGLASALIRAAMAIAWARWPGERLYTYVNARRVRSANPGFCFKQAGWRLCGVTKTRKLLILEALPMSENTMPADGVQASAEPDRRSSFQRESDAIAETFRTAPVYGTDGVPGTAEGQQ